MARGSLWPRRREAGVAALLAFGLCVLSSHLRPSAYNNYALFADALLHGHLWIDWPGDYIDAVLWHGHRYIVNDPVPGVLLLPLAAVMGKNANQTALAATVAALAVYWAMRLAMRLNCSRAVRYWLVAFYFAGTDFWWCASFGDVWFLAQVCAVCALTGALLEIAGKNRPWLVALAWIAAILSRFTLVMATPAVIALVLFGFEAKLREDWRRAVGQFALTALPFLLLYTWYNEARWGLPYDIGHTVFYHQDSIGSVDGSPFSLANFPYELYSLFVQPPSVVGSFPWLIPQQAGTALTWTSPALIFVLWARRPQLVVWTLLAATCLAAGPSLLYYVNGSMQFGMRHALDFMPFCFVLMLLAARERFPSWVPVLCAWSIVAGAWGIWYWRLYIRPFS